MCFTGPLFLSLIFYLILIDQYVLSFCFALSIKCAMINPYLKNFQSPLGEVLKRLDSGGEKISYLTRGSHSIIPFDGQN